MNFYQELVASDIIARNMIKIAILDKTINERTYTALMKKSRSKLSSLSDNFYIYGVFIILAMTTILLIFGGLNEIFYYIGGLAGLSLLLIPFIDMLYRKIYDGIVLMKTIGKKKNVNAELEPYKNDFPEIYAVIEKSFEIVNEDGAIDNFIAMFYSDFLTEMIIDIENPIMKENIKRVSFSIAHGTFIVESLDLETLTENQTYLEGLSKVLDAFEYIIKKQKIDDNELPFFKNKFPEIKKSISSMKIIIEKIKQIKEDKTLAKNLDKQSAKLRKIVEKEPIPKTQIKDIRSPSGMKKDHTLTTISAMDEEIIEIRTRAGNYYVSKKYFDHEIIQERRMFKLLTDKELEIKIEVLNSTLEMLEQTKKDIPKKEYELIKSDYLAQLFSSEKLLEQRKGKGQSIICPHCSAKNSSVIRKCKKCGKELPYCIICLSSIGKGTEIGICPHCSSFAHANHFKDWLEKTNTCPYCKKKIRKELETTVLESTKKIELKT